MMKPIHLSLAALALTAWITAGCGDSASDNHDDHDHSHAADDAHDHSHDDHSHDDHAHDDHDHAHDEIDLEPITINDMTIELAQGHGAIEAGKEGHLVVKLPYSDNGQTIVRAWIGSEDRTLSFVGKGDYAPSHDDYDIHAMAPNPLPENTMWWIEIEKPDGTRLVGSAKPILE